MMLSVKSRCMALIWALLALKLAPQAQCQVNDAVVRDLENLESVLKDMDPFVQDAVNNATVHLLTDVLEATSQGPASTRGAFAEAATVDGSANRGGGSRGPSKCDKCNVPVSQGGCKCNNNCDCISMSGPAPSKCDKCNIPVSQGGCKCNNNCDCISTSGPAPSKCDKCNVPVSQGGCKCNNNCDCISTPGPTPPGHCPTPNPVPNAGDTISITAITPGPSVNGQPNTVVGTAGSAFAASLLSAGTPAVLWGIVPAATVTRVCQMVVYTGTHSIRARVSGSNNGGWGAGTVDTTLQLIATGGCCSSSDESGTQFLFQLPSQRRIAIVCPDNAGQVGCGIWWTGSDAAAAYEDRKRSTGRRLQSDVVGAEVGEVATRAASRGLLATAGEGCVNEMKTAGGCTGAILGPIGICAPFLGPFAIFCGLGGFGACMGLVCAAGAGSATGCFPGDAGVMLRSGDWLPMSDLRVGDEVAVLGPQGSVAFDHVYAFGHDDKHAVSSFIKIATAGGRQLELTAQHFVPTYLSGRADAAMLYKRARDVAVGDYVMVLPNSTVGSAMKTMVIGISSSFNQGLYNPLTMHGTIVVNGVAASSHSEWFADSVFDYLGAPHHLPYVYQGLLAPARLLFSVLGSTTYTALYYWLDKNIGGIADFGTAHGGAIFLAGASVGTAVVLLAASRFNPRIRSCQLGQ